jgi:hypothetical protein
LGTGKSLATPVVAAASATAAGIVVVLLLVVFVVNGRFSKKLLDYECGKICEMHSALKLLGSFDRMIY